MNKSCRQTLFMMGKKRTPSTPLKSSVLKKKIQKIKTKTPPPTISLVDYIIDCVGIKEYDTYHYTRVVDVPNSTTGGGLPECGGGVGVGVPITETDEVIEIKIMAPKIPETICIDVGVKNLGLALCHARQFYLISFDDNTDLLQTIYTLLFRIKHSSGIYQVIMERQFANTNKKTQFGIEGVLAVLNLKRLLLISPMTRNKHTMSKLGWRYKKTRSKKAYDALIATQEKVAELFVGWEKTHLIASGVLPAAKHPHRADEDGTFITSLYQQPTNFLKKYDDYIDTILMWDCSLPIMSDSDDSDDNDSSRHS